MNGERGHYSGASAEANLPGLLDLATLWQRKWYLAFSVALTVGLGVLYLRQTVPVYESEARVLVQHNALSDKGRVLRDDKFFLATQAEIIWSPLTIEHALKAAPEAAPTPLVLPDGTVVDPVPQVLKNLRVVPLEATNVLKIAVRGSEPEKSNRLIMAIIDSYAEQVRDNELAQNAASLRLLESREQKLRGEMHALREQFREKRQESPLIGLGNDATSIQLALLRNLDIRLAENRNRRMDLRNRLQVSAFSPRDRKGPRVADLARESKPATFREPGEFAPASQPYDDASDEERSTYVAYNLTALQDAQTPAPSRVTEEALLVSDEIDKIRLQLVDAETVARQLSLQLGPRHPQVRAAGEQVAALESSLSGSQQRAAALKAEEIEALHLEVEALKLTEDNLTEIYNAEMDQAKKLDGYLLEEQDLVRQIQRLEEAHQVTLEKLADTQLSVQALTEGHNFIEVRVLETPGLAEAQVWPKPVQFLGICALIGLVGGCVLVSMLELRQQTAPVPVLQRAPADGTAGRPALA